MDTLRLKKKDLNLKDFVKRTALEEDASVLIEKPTIVLDEANGETKIIYDNLDFDTSEIVRALRGITYHEGQRSRGLTSRSRIFGYRPRLEMRGDFCSSTSMAREYPNEHALVTDLALRLESYYEKYHQAGYLRHKGLAEEKVKPNYRISDGKSIFTSGIINKNNPLKYHYDTGNFNNVYSCMVVFKNDVEGGALAIPEYGVRFKLPNNSIFLFDGQSILHGVTPIKFSCADSYRYSIVYYSLKRMWQCLEIDDELARVRMRKTQRERVRMENPLTEDDRVKKEANVALLKKRFGKQ